MAKLVFRVSADYEEVVKLRNEIAKLKSELKGMDATRTPAALEALNDKLSSSTKRMNELVTVAANAGAAMEGDFKKELNDLAQLAPRLDLAMFPVDPRMGGDFMRGARQFLDRIPTSCFVPMHFWAQPQKVAPFKPYAESKKTRFVLLGEPGENYEL